MGILANLLSFAGFPFLQGRLRTREHRFYSIIDFSGCQGVFSGFFNKISLMRCSKAFPMIRLPK